MPLPFTPAAPVAPVDACVSCGACCIAPPGGDGRPYFGYVQLVPEDRGIPRRLRLHAFSERFMKVCPTSGRCAALQGIVGVDVRCSTYETRPAVCRGFAPGTLACATAREDRGLSPLPPSEASTTDPLVWEIPCP